MNILITGASGFVGPILIKQIKNRYPDSNIYGTYYLHHECELIDSSDATPIYMNLSETNSIKVALNKSRPDYIYHLAAQSSGKISWENPALTFDINVKGSINLINSISELNLKPRILCIGSSEQYGIVTDKPVDEITICRPENPYGSSKKSQEDILRILGKANNLDICFTRSFNHTGINQTTQFVIPDWCKQIAMIEHGQQSPEISVGNLDVIRDFSDVESVCQAYIDIMEKGISFEVYNVGSGRGVSLKYILDYLLKLSNKQISISIDKNRLRPSENPIIICDNRKLKEISKTEFIKIETLLEKILNSWRLRLEEKV